LKQLWDQEVEEMFMLLHFRTALEAKPVLKKEFTMKDVRTVKLELKGRIS